jgi:hypothetical protein
LLPVESNFPGGNEPAIDGIFVYPEIQERRQPDGFTEFIVSGYGRTSDTLQNQQKRVSTRLTSTSSSQALISQNVFVSSNEVSGFIVIEKNSGLDVGDLGFAPNYFDLYNITPHSSVIQIKISSFNTRPYSSYIDWNGDLKNSSLKTIGLQFSNTQGQFVDGTVYDISYISPRITVISRNNFGRFIELEIKVQ